MESTYWILDTSFLNLHITIQFVRLFQWEDATTLSPRDVTLLLMYIHMNVMMISAFSKVVWRRMHVGCRAKVRNGDFGLNVRMMDCCRLCDELPRVNLTESRR